MKSNQQELAGATILVTGGCGYLGSRLVRYLAQSRSPRLRVRILDNLQRELTQALWDLPDGGTYEFLEADLLDPAGLDLAVQGVDAVVHLAGLVRSPFSFDNPQWLEQVNHWGTAHLVNACVEAGVPRLVYASTAAVYGPGERHDETSVCRPLGPYAQSKRRAEVAVLAGGVRGVRPAVLRFGSFYGLAPVTRFDTVVNRLSYLAGIRRALTVYGEGSQRRPVIHVADAADLIRFVLTDTSGVVPEVLNAVTQNPSVLDISDAIRAERPEVELRYTDQDVLTHLSLTVANERMLQTGWVAQYDVTRGVAELLERFRNLSRAGYQTG